MAISEFGPVVESQQWPQHDIRDPLGVWGVRHTVTGDASGGGIKVGYQVNLSKAGAFVYTCYSVNVAQTDAFVTGTVLAKVRLLTNWPDIDPAAGAQGYGSNQVLAWAGSANFTAPFKGFFGESGPALQPTDRFLLLYQPRKVPAGPTIVEIELAINTDGGTYVFEGYGYYWDRSVLNAPGGPRHPGSS